MIGVGPTELGILIFMMAIPVIAVWKIAEKAGLSPLIGLTQLFPPLGILGLLYIAFTKWPIKNEEQPEQTT